jgi:hypothetical protein
MKQELGLLKSRVIDKSAAELRCCKLAPVPYVVLQSSRRWKPHFTIPHLTPLYAPCYILASSLQPALPFLQTKPHYSALVGRQLYWTALYRTNEFQTHGRFYRATFVLVAWKISPNNCLFKNTDISCLTILIRSGKTQSAKGIGAKWAPYFRKNSR